MKQNNQAANDQGFITGKKQWLFGILFVAIAAMSIFAVAAQSRDFSLKDFGSYIGQASAPWLIAAVLSMLCFIIFEALALKVLCHALGHKRKFRQVYGYAVADIYLSSITPSATGGQPASAYFMIKDGMDGMKTTAILIANLCLYTLAIVVIGIVCFVLRFDIFLQYETLPRIMVLAGFFMQLGLLVFFFMLLRHERFLHRMCSAVLRFLCKIRILKRLEERQAKLDAYMENYRAHSKLITAHPKAMLLCFLCNFFQRSCQIAVTMFVFAATAGKGFLESAELWFRQGYASIGATCLPMPGSMGISDYMMLDSFKKIMTESQAVNLQLLSRSISFYSCVIICGVSTLLYYCVVKKRGARKC